LRQDEEGEQECRGEKKQNSDDQIVSRSWAQQKCGDCKQHCAAKVKETKVVRKNERDSKYGCGDKDANYECDQSHFPDHAMCW
jgi:hypothetical protein